MKDLTASLYKLYTVDEHIDNYLDHLANHLPLLKRQFKVHTHNSKLLPESLVFHDVKNPVGVAIQRATETEAHITTEHSLRKVLNTLAHEYRHAWQYDQGDKVTDKNRYKLEWDAHRFALITTNDYCRTNGIPLD